MVQEFSRNRCFYVSLIRMFVHEIQLVVGRVYPFVPSMKYRGEMILYHSNNNLAKYEGVCKKLTMQKAKPQTFQPRFDGANFSISIRRRQSVAEPISVEYLFSKTNPMNGPQTSLILFVFGTLLYSVGKSRILTTEQVKIKCICSVILTSKAVRVYFT